MTIENFNGVRIMIREITLSRELANVIQHELETNPNSVPESIRQAYMRLYGEYIRQQQSDEYIP